MHRFIFCPKCRSSFVPWSFNDHSSRTTTAGWEEMFVEKLWHPAQPRTIDKEKLGSRPFLLEWTNGKPCVSAGSAEQRNRGSNEKAWTCTRTCPACGTKPASQLVAPAIDRCLCSIEIIPHTATCGQTHRQKGASFWLTQETGSVELVETIGTHYQAYKYTQTFMLRYASGVCVCVLVVPFLKQTDTA